MKGIFFSMILIFMVMFLILFISIQKSLTHYYSSQKAVENRINAMSEFYEGIVLDSKKSFDIIGRRALSAAINYVVSNNHPLESANSTIVELMENGTIDGVQQGLMETSKLEDWKNTIQYLGEIQGFKTKISISNITVQPEDSFHLSVSYMISINISDPTVQAGINRTSGQYLSMSIENLEDPTYPLNTFGRVVNVIKKSPHWLNYSSTDLTNLKDDLNNSYYHPSLNGASFLDRLEGKYFVQDKYRKTNPIGLESFVNKDKILSSGLPISFNATNIDYLYFSGSGVRAYSISGMPSNFRLDDQLTVDGKTHLQIYNVTVS